MQQLRERLTGWSYGTALIVCGAVVLVSSMLALDLLVLSIQHPFLLGEWHQHLWPHNRITAVVMLIQAGLVALVMAWPR